MRILANKLESRVYVYLTPHVVDHLDLIVEGEAFGKYVGAEVERVQVEHVAGDLVLSVVGLFAEQAKIVLHCIVVPVLQ